ncbi:MAG: hypothetical protein ACR2F8_10925 [Caulobacteraceae bacterium]
MTKRNLYVPVPFVDGDRAIEPATQPAAGLCEAVGLDPARLAWKDDGWVVKADPDDPSRPGDTPLKTWRPVFPSAIPVAPIPVPLE